MTAPIAQGPVDVTVRLRARKADRSLHEAAATEIERLRKSLTDTLYFLERHSNRWDGVNGKHPHTVVEEARALLKPNDQGNGPRQAQLAEGPR